MTEMKALLSEAEALKESAVQEEPVKFEDLSENCKKAIKRFKSWLKKHVGENHCNVIVESDLYKNPTIFNQSKLLILPFTFKIKTSFGFLNIKTLFKSLACQFDVSNEESDKALKLMQSKNFYYMPKIKISLATKKTRKTEVNNA